MIAFARINTSTGSLVLFCAVASAFERYKIFFNITIQRRIRPEIQLISIGVAKRSLRVPLFRPSGNRERTLAIVFQLRGPNKSCRRHAVERSATPRNIVPSHARGTGAFIDRNARLLKTISGLCFTHCRFRQYRFRHGNRLIDHEWLLADSTIHLIPHFPRKYAWVGNEIDNGIEHEPGTENPENAPQDQPEFFFGFGNSF